MAGHGQIVSGYGFATGIIVLLVMSLVALTAVRLLHRRRRPHIRGEVSTAATPAAQQDRTPVCAAQSNPPGTPRPMDVTPPIRYDRIFLLIAEGLVVRERLAGHIDADTYQSRMHDLASGGRT